MRRRLLKLLACPDCRGDITGDFEEELVEGELQCCDCGRTFPVTSGVPALLPEALSKQTATVAKQFAQQWMHYNEHRAEYRDQFLDWIKPVQPEFFEGKVVLDGGCGKGRHLRVASEFGPELVVGLDLGESVYVANSACRGLDNVEVVRGDLLNVPFKEGVFDYGYSVGVLHHLPDPRRGFNEVTRSVKPGGRISAWVYGLENNEWIVHLVDPFRKNISSHLPRPVLRGISWFLAGILYWVIRLVYLPCKVLFPELRLPLKKYLLYISRFPHRELETIVYDQLSPQIAYYLPRESFEAWFEDLDEVVIGWQNEMSWRGFARKPD